MKTGLSRNSRCVASRMAVAGASLLILAGCDPGSDAAPRSRQSSGSSTDANHSPNSVKERNSSADPAAEVRSKAQSVPGEKNGNSMADVAAFGDAALEGSLESVRQAIDSGIDVNATDEQQRTALMLASFNGHAPVVQLLLSRGARIDSRDAIGRTALMFAATGANRDAVKLLIDAGAGINEVDSVEGFTALMHAAAEGQVEVVEILLDHQADPDITDVDGDTAFDFAKRNGHTAVANLLSD